MRVKSKLSILIAFAMLISILGGCAAQSSLVKVNLDGSGYIVVELGFTKEGLELVAEDSGEEITAEDIEKLHKFVIDETEYYGEKAEWTFNSLEEFSSIFSDIADDIIGEELREELDSQSNLISTSLLGDMRMEWTADGNILLYLTVPAADLETDQLANIDKSELTEEDIESYYKVREMYDDFAQQITFVMPGKITNLSSYTEGITIDGDELTIDYVEASDKVDSRELKFEIDIEKEGSIVFTDVKPNDWFYKAIMKMANVNGILQGYGDNRFGPNDKLTVAQFVTILFRYTGEGDGTLVDYWALEPIQWALINNYIKDRGEVVSANYDVPIAREEAIAAIQNILKPVSVVDTPVTDTDIPDLNTISLEYRDVIVQAYNSGLTDGVDIHKTFNPLGVMTRAEICQLLYNIESRQPLY